MRIRSPLIKILIIGFFIRLAVGIFLTYTIDISYWIQTSSNLDSGMGLYDGTGYYYTPIWGYYMGFFTYIGNLFGIDPGFICMDLLTESDLQYKVVVIPSVLYGLLIKIPLMLSDLAVGALIYYMLKRVTRNERKALIGCAIWIFCPLVIYVSSVQGMFDTIMVLFMMLSLVLLMEKRYFLSGAALSLAVFTKLFPILLVPVFVAYVLVMNKGNNRKMVEGLLKSVTGFFVAMAAVLLPIIISGHLSRAFTFFTNRMETASSSVSSIWDIFDYSMMTYLSPIIVIVCVALAYFLYRSKRQNKEFLLITFSFFSMGLMFILPAVTQYYLVLVPFLAYFIVMTDSKYSKIVLILITIIALAKVLQYNSMLLYSFFMSMGWDISGLIDINLVAERGWGDIMTAVNTIAKLGIIATLALFAVKMNERRRVIADD